MYQMDSYSLKNINIHTKGVKQMAKLDSQNRLTIPKDLVEISDTDFNGTLLLFAKGKELFLDNSSQKNFKCHCLGEIHLDEHRRFFLPKLAREIFNLKPGDNINFYVLEGKVTFKKFFFIPEIR